MTNSKQIAALLGPTGVAMLVAEFPLVVYLSGVLMFVAGLAILRAHNIWVRNWTVLVMLGVVCIASGLGSNVKAISRYHFHFDTERMGQ